TGEVIEWLQERYPEKLIFSNMGNIDHADEFAPRLESYLEHSNPDILMFDWYPFRLEKEATEEKLRRFYSDLWLLRAKGLETGIPYWVFIQAWEATATDAAAERLPSESDLRMQVFSALA